MTPDEAKSTHEYFSDHCCQWSGSGEGHAHFMRVCEALCFLYPTENIKHSPIKDALKDLNELESSSLYQGSPDEEVIRLFGDAMIIHSHTIRKLLKRSYD